MSAKIIDGKAIAENLLQDLKKEIDVRSKKGIRNPSLAVVLIGSNPASSIYVKNKRLACEKIGVKSIAYDLPNETSEKELLTLIETLNNDKLLPATNAVPERFEFGTLPYELMAGCIAAVDFIADMAPGSATTRRERIVNSMNALEKYEDELLEYLESCIEALPGVTMYGHASRRTPTIYFSFTGHASADIYKAMAAKKVTLPASNFYALEVSRKLGLGDAGALRAGLAPYSTRNDVDRLVAGLLELVKP